jgi:subtilase family serine protease
MASAACPHCKILLVEAKSPSFADLGTAENTAARLGAQIISNSYGGQESGFDQQFDSAYNHPGHTIVVSSGDLGYRAANSPANLATVTAVGGTQLSKASNARGWKESAWNAGGAAAGSGCSVYVAKPSWQHDTRCPGRTEADVSALAWNIALYDTSLRGLGGPWVTIGGTSAAAPIIAGVYGLAGNAAHITTRYPYQHRTHLFDITTGTNALTNTPAKVCGSTYMCVAKPGYDAPTGLGTPNGIAGF